MDKILKEKLAKISPEKLAAFLEKEAAINPEFMESVERLANHDSPDKILDSILDEIESIGGSHKFIDWRESARFSQTLGRVTYNIETLLLPKYPEVALKALDAFLKISSSVIERSDDSMGDVGSEFSYAVDVWGKAWSHLAHFDGKTLANAIWEYFKNNDYGLYDNMISSAADALKRCGLTELEELIKLNCLNEKPRAAFHALHDIALLHQSPEAFIEAFKLTNQNISPSDQLELARLLIDIARVDEAIALLKSIKSEYERYKHTDLLIEAYLIKGNTDIVQQLRWDGFVKQHRKELFQIYYDNLSSEEEKKKALDLAIATAQTWDVISSISTLFDMGQPEIAAAILLMHYDKLQGHQYYTLKDFAEKFIKTGFPLQAILIYRRLTEDILARTQSKYYHHAINYLKKSKEISVYIKDWKQYPTTISYFNQLKELHRRKRSFMEKFGNI